MVNKLPKDERDRTCLSGQRFRNIGLDPEDKLIDSHLSSFLFNFVTFNKTVIYVVRNMQLQK